MKTLTAVLTLLLATTLHAQTTWHGLHFGMSADEVRSALSAQGIAVATSQDGSLQATADTQLMLPGLLHTLPVRPDFRFTDAGGLMDITLHLNFTALKQNYTEYRTDDALIAFASDRITRALTNIYASPIFTTPGCDNDPVTATQSLSCTTNWRGTGQSVAIDWTTHPDRLYIRYQMLSPDL